MQREILFRGKRVSNGEWVYGCPIKFNGVLFMATIVECSEDMEDKFEWVKVIPETVGQFTGLTDSNGTKIFEGDIVRFNDWNRDTGNPINGRISTIKWLNKGWFFDSEGPIEWKSIQVTGNIHDKQ